MTSSTVAVATWLAGTVHAIPPDQLADRLARNENILVVDVRSATAYEAGHVPGAINIPLSLLPHKTIPTSQLVVVYGDGLGVIADTDALVAVRAKSAVNAEVLEGGYAAWLTQTRLSTQRSGLGREQLPGITYQQLVAAAKDNIVLVDLRVPGAPPLPAASSEDGQSVAATQGPDLVASFAQKLGVPLVRAGGATAFAAARNTDPERYAAAAATTAAAQVDSGDGAGKLLVLVADSDAAANEAARHLRAAGYYRFTILIGGTEIIRFEGRQGTGRQGGDLPVTSGQP